MTNEELLKVYAYAGAVWNSFKLPNNDLELKIQNEVWLSKLCEFSLSTIFAAIDEYARNNSFCNIIQITDICNKFESIRNGTYVTEDMILNEIRNAVSYDKCRENYANLSPLAKKFVPGSYMLAKWAMNEDFHSVIISNLRKEIKSYFENERMKATFKKMQSLEFANKKLLEKGGTQNG